MNDYKILFDVDARSAPVEQRVRLTWPSSWSVDVAPDNVHGALVVYRVNRLNELLHAVMPHHEATMPELRYKLQMYIDAHIPAAAAMQGRVGCTLDAPRMMLPDVPMASTMMRFTGEVARALMYTPKKQVLKRNSKRVKPLWEIIR